MSNAVAPRASGAITSLQGLKQGLANVHSSAPSASRDPFLRLLKDGIWVYGADDTEIEDGSLWAIHPGSLQHGYVAWTNYDPKLKKANEVLGERMVPMTEPLPNFEALPELSEPTAEWKQQLSLVVACTNGADAGTQVLYKTTAVGGINAVRDLIAEIMKQLDEDPGHPVPVVELAADSYKHKQYGKVFTPEFVVKSWVAMDATEVAEPEAPQAEETQPEPEETKASEDNEPASDDAGSEGGTRRRRRRAA